MAAGLQRRRFVLGATLVALAAAGVWITPAATRESVDGHLEAIVGTNDGFDITLNDASGRKVASLAPGTYTIVVHDRSAIHNFHSPRTTTRRSTSARTCRSSAT
jgi:hypothetical protein